MAAFQLAQRLADDCEFLLDWPLCRVLLMRDAHYPWFILVPRRPDLRELCELNEADEIQLQRESRFLSGFLINELKAYKLNIAALGNVEPQLHIHYIARFESDPAWPAPVWGALPPKAYETETLATLMQNARQALAKL